MYERFLTFGVVCLLVATIIVSAVKDRSYEKQINRLNYACMPVDTGGGVTQCLQPSVKDTTLRSCLLNNNNIGVTQEDTRHLLVKCLDAGK